MLRNSVYYKSLLLFFALLFTLTCLNAESQTTTLSEFNTAIAVVTSVEGEITRAMGTLGQFNAVRGDILTMLADNNEDKRENIINSSSLEGAVSSSINALGDFVDGIALNNALSGVNASIKTFISEKIDKGIFQRQGNADGTVVGYNQAYDNYVSAYDGLSKADRQTVNEYWFATTSDDKFYKPKLSVPSANSVFVTK